MIRELDVNLVEITEILADIFIDLSNLWKVAYFRKRYLPNGITLSVIESQIDTQYPRVYLELVKDCYEMAINFVESGQPFFLIEKTVDAHFFHKMKSTFRTKPQTEIL